MIPKPLAEQDRLSSAVSNYSIRMRNDTSEEMETQDIFKGMQKSDTSLVSKVKTLPAARNDLECATEKIIAQYPVYANWAPC